MLPKPSVDAYRAETISIVTQIFSTMLATEVRALETEWPSNEPHLTAVVFYAGDWRGALSISCTRPQACYFVGKLMCSDAAPQVNDEVRDGLGELANMIGGNLQPMLPPGTNLSIPTVVEGHDFRLWFCGGDPVHWVTFDSPAGVFRVMLLTEAGIENR